MVHLHLDFREIFFFVMKNITNKKIFYTYEIANIITQL